MSTGRNSPESKKSEVNHRLKVGSEPSVPVYIYFEKVKDSQNFLLKSRFFTFKWV